MIETDQVMIVVCCCFSTLLKIITTSSHPHAWVSVGVSLNLNVMSRVPEQMHHVSQISRGWCLYWENVNINGMHRVRDMCLMLRPLSQNRGGAPVGECEHKRHASRARPMPHAHPQTPKSGWLSVNIDGMYRVARHLPYAPPYLTSASCLKWMV